MEIITETIALSTLKSKYMNFFPDMIKADVDTEKRVLAVDAELHADLETLLLDNGSLQENIWGINIYPANSPDECIEFTSLINIRPSQNNFSMEVEDEDTKQKITEIVKGLIDFES